MNNEHGKRSSHVKNMMHFLALVSTAILLFFTPFQVTAHYCGKIKGNKIITHGNLSCAKAKHVYKAFQNGHTPKGWACGLSAGSCESDDGKKGFTFRLN